MFAGKLKLRTFVLIAVPIMGLLAAAGAYGVWAAYEEAKAEVQELARKQQAREAEAAAEAARIEADEEARRRNAPPIAPVAIDRADAGDPSRPWDSAVMGYQGKDLGADKKKDVTKGKPYKVNVYQDAGKATANRAKVDLDRDDKWDEKWTFDDGAVSRQVAPNDDEDYTQTYVWSGDAWVAE